MRRAWRESRRAGAAARRSIARRAGEQALLRISQLAWQLRDEIAAIDINPLLVLLLTLGRRGPRCADR